MLDKRNKGKGILSPRQAEVLSLIAFGDTHKEIARKLHVEVTTIRTHVRDARQKLDALSATHAVMVAYEMGILPKVDLGVPPAVPVILDGEDVTEGELETFVEAPKESKPSAIKGLLETFELSAPWLNMTARELEIFSEYGRSAHGRAPTNAQIADKCGASLTSMKQHARRIKRALGIPPHSPTGREQVVILSRIYNLAIDLKTHTATTG